MQYESLETNICLYLERSLKSVIEDLRHKLPRHSAGEIKVELEIPKEKSNGDLSTNVAMKACKPAGRPPLEIAGLVKARFERDISRSGLKSAIDRVEIKPPGFINFFISRHYLGRVLFEIKRRKKNYGRSGMGRGSKLQVEFVSANPTGPLTIAHGRQAAIGDSLANILEFLGHRVTREYYLNDEGTQMDILAASIRSRYLDLCNVKEDFPRDGYKGTYISDIARDFKKRCGRKPAKSTDLDAFRSFGLRWILQDIKLDLKDFGVKFNTWYSQRSLRRSGRVEKAISFLKDKGYIYEKEGAIWFRSTDFGDDKDRVVVKSDGSATYLAPDIAYHLEKYRRGFKKIVDIWGPDHHGYVPRMKAAIEALGFSRDSLSVLIVQLATLYRSGAVVSMSTRAGEFVTLREVMDEVGKDAARFCFLMRRVSSHLDFDLDAVKKKSAENPVYYIQYAHARIWSILKHSKARRIHLTAKLDLKLLKEPEELELMRSLRQFPPVVASAGKALEPYIVLQYLQELAAIFHGFYNHHRVIGDVHDLTKSRLLLVDCVRMVLANGLRLLGVSLPKKM